jgi:hypothetical protein
MGEALKIIYDNDRNSGENGGGGELKYLKVTTAEGMEAVFKQRPGEIMEKFEIRVSRYFSDETTFNKNASKRNGNGRV